MRPRDSGCPFLTVTLCYFTLLSNIYVLLFQNSTVAETGRLAQLVSACYRFGRCGVRFPGWSNGHSVASGAPPLRRFFDDVYSPGAKQPR